MTENEPNAFTLIYRLPADQKKLALRLTAEISLTLERPKIDLIQRIRANGIVGYKINDDGSISLKYSETAQIQIGVLETSLKNLLEFAADMALDLVTKESEKKS